MSLRDDNFTDKHLQKALQHAPDSDVAPSESARKVVLDYANTALKLGHKTRRESWFARLKKVFHAWQLPRWQLAGMGSLAASVLVVVMIWHENPEDPMQVAPAPEAVQIEAAPTQAAPKLVIAESAPAAASAEMAAPKLQEKAKENELAKTKPTKPETDTAPQVSIEAPADKTILAGAPEEASRQASEKEAESIRPKEAVVTAEVAPPAPVAAAPAPQPAIASADAASGQTLARAAAKPEPMNKATKKMEDAAQTQPELKADLPSAIGAAKPAVQSSALALALGRQGGQTLANADIQAGKLRILSLSNKAASGSVDDATGYRKEEVIVEDEANLKSLAAEVEAYNQTMREWYLNN